MAQTFPFAWRNAFWWAIYLLAAFWLQLRLPGLDALIPGLVIACQEKRPQQLAWLLILCLLIQEGTGNLAFGGTLLWYGCLLASFRIGEFFFATGGLFFVILLAVCLGVTHAAILFTFGALQNLPVPIFRLVEQALAQAALIPVVWGPAHLIRKRFLRHVDGI